MNKKKMTAAFLSRYVLLEEECTKKFGLQSGGVNEYVERLNNTRYAPHRDEVLSSLVRLRNLHNKLAATTDAPPQPTELCRADLEWVSDFYKQLKKKRDPLSVYLHKARSYARHRKTRRILLFLLIALILIGALVLVYLLLLR